MNAGKAISMIAATRTFGDLIAVDNLSFEVERGEIFGLLGPNGAGKTTAINLILGLLKAHAGKIQVLDLDINSQTRQIYQKVGYVPQETNLYLDLSAIDNLMHHAALYCADLKSVKGKIEELLHFTNLWERRKDPVKTYSGGMKRRLALARSLLHDPELIFFDEPTLGVDVQGRLALWDHIQEQKETGKTFVISTNNMVEAETLCDRVLIIDHGKAIALDTPDNLKTAMQNDVVNIQTTPPIADPKDLLSGYKISNITRTEPSGLRFEMPGADTSTSELIKSITQDHTLESILISRPTLDDVFLFHTGRGLRE